MIHHNAVEVFKWKAWEKGAHPILKIKIALFSNLGRKRAKKTKLFSTNFCSVRCMIKLKINWLSPLSYRYECNCTDTGFNGTECQYNIDDCAILDPCQNNASCTDLVKVGVSYMSIHAMITKWNFSIQAMNNWYIISSYLSLW